MYKHFFSHVDVLPQNINILNGNAPDLKTECEEYEARIKTVGGIELFLGGIGPDGHVAFNEPGSSLTSRTRVKTLAEDTIRANSRFFDNDMSKVPRMALTVGIQTVLDAREVAIIITGAHKSLALQRCIEGGVNHMWTLSALQMHPQTLIAVDEDATLELQVKTVKVCNYPFHTFVFHLFHRIPFPELQLTEENNNNQYFKSIEHVQLSSTSHAANTVTTPSTTSNPKPLTLNTSNRDPNPADPEDLTPDSMSSRILTASPTQTQPQFQTGTKSKQDFASKRDRQQSIDSAIGGFGFSTPVSASVRSNDGEEAEDSSPLEGKGNGSTNGGRVRFSNVVV